jgi:Carboxypeptidase regulatory-like domain
MLPRSGEWLVDVVVPPSSDALAVDTTVVPDEESNVARADVTVPETLVEGIVVDTAGAPVPQADVTFTRGPQRLAVATTNAQGQFAVRGVTPGLADIVASASGARSSAVNVTVNDGPNTPLRLIVHKLATLKSQIVGPAGPVPGARVAIWPEGGGRVSLTIADSEGYFTAMGHPPTQRLHIAIHSPGLALLLQTVPGDATPLPPRFSLSTASGALEIVGGSRISYVEYGPVLLPVQLAVRLLAPAATMESEGRSVRLNDFPPGQYRACSVSSSAVPAAPTCASGWLAPGATLQLKVPTSQ